MNRTSIKAVQITSEPDDLTGRSRMSKNVLASWGGYLVFVVAGFIMPRMIDRQIGQTSLGIWDFCWSLVSYLSLASLGVGSSVNRYVAKYRARNDVDSLCRAVSSVILIQLIIALLVFLSAMALVWMLPLLFSDQLGTEIEVARWVVPLLGASLAVQMAFDPFRGVITGCHRWDLHNGINAGAHAATVGGMITVLLLGGSLCSLSLVYLFSVIATEIIRMMLAHHICPELRIRLAYAGWYEGKKMLLFGIGTVVVGLPPLVLVQTINIFVTGTLGAASLAVFARPIALVRHVETFMNKFAFVLTPSAGALQASGRNTELKQFLIDTTRFGVAVTLPIIIFLTIFSDFILELWMGPKYAHGLILAILSMGYFLPISQNATLRILMGMNLHGRIGIISLMVTLIVFGLGIIIINILGWNLIYFALLVSIPLAIGNGIIIPIYACSKLDIPLIEYFSRVFLGPIICNLAFALCLASGRLLFQDNALAAFGFGGVGGAIALGILYWCYILSAQHQAKILRLFKGKLPSRRPRVKEEIF